jgi:hypothetical protein
MKIVIRILVMLFTKRGRAILEEVLALVESLDELASDLARTAKEEVSKPKENPDEISF